MGTVRTDAVKSALRSLVRRLGIDIVRHGGRGALPADFDAGAAAIIRRAAPYTMTSYERLFALVESARYVSRCAIPGDIVECGVWRGGSMMAAALALLERNDTSRTLHLFDTYEGMTAPTRRDVAIDGSAARELLEARSKSEDDPVWAYAALDRVKAAMATTGYDPARIRFVAGPVEQTLPGAAPERIALLRLDTDWYESTRHELRHLYPRLSRGGVLIIDDYGHWKGAREAVDEYLAETGAKLLLNRIDYTGRVAVKTE
jgi:O-methyltransferase